MPVRRRIIPLVARPAARSRPLATVETPLKSQLAWFAAEATTQTRTLATCAQFAPRTTIVPIQPRSTLAPGVFIAPLVLQPTAEPAHRGCIAALTLGVTMDTTQAQAGKCARFAPLVICAVCDSKLTTWPFQLAITPCRVSRRSSFALQATRALKLRTQSPAVRAGTQLKVI